MRGSGRGPTYQDVVPRELALRIAEERDALAEELQRSRVALDAARQRLAASEDENSQLRAALQAQHHAAARPPQAEVQPESTPQIQRLAADLANLRRRQGGELAAARRQEVVRLLASVAEARDSVSRALSQADDGDSPWVLGLRGVLAQLDGVLAAEGAKVVGRAGERYDPHLHEAVATAPHPEGLAGVLLEVVRPAVVLEDGTLVRAGQVVVSSA